MKFFILALMLTVALAVPTDKDEEDWKAFKKQFGKNFASKNTETKRKNAFLKNKAKIDEINEKASRGERSFKAKLYEFSDLEDEEFYAQYANLKLVKGNKGERNNTKVEKSLDLPESRQTLPTNYDARNYFRFSPVRNQNPCGSCWAFAAINTLEVAVWKKFYAPGTTVWDLSEQELVDCALDPSIFGWTNGCRGYYFGGAIDYLGTVGLTLERDYPYTASYNNYCKNTPKYFGTPSRVFIGSDETSIKNAIMQYGSLGISVYADWDWSYYDGFGVYSNPAYTSISDFEDYVNHAVTLVGWGYDASFDMDYWLIRNSWGSTWGDNGYIRVATDASGLFYPYDVEAVTF